MVGNKQPRRPVVLRATLIKECRESRAELEGVPSLAAFFSLDVDAF
jgi:hypothetical protein